MLRTKKIRYQNFSSGKLVPTYLFGSQILGEIWRLLLWHWNQELTGINVKLS